MTREINKAMILAAGFGLRLRPLTNQRPKPLLPLNGQLVIDHQLDYLKDHGFKDIVINLHYLGDMIRRHVGDGSARGLKVSYSHEEEILGIGGGIKNAERFFTGEAVLTINAKAIIDVDLKDVVSRHLSSGATATMVLMRKPAGDEHTPVSADADMRITCFGSGDFMYTGVQILSPEFIEALPEGRPSSLIQDGYEPMMRRSKTIAAYIHSGYFVALESAEDYDRLRGDIASGRAGRSY